MDKTYNLIKTK